MIDYGHGDDLYKYKGVVFKANFSSNVCYTGAPEKLLYHLESTLKTIENYPAPSSENLVRKIEEYHNLPPKSTIVTNGATEAFYLTTSAFHSASVTICTPSFSEYEQASSAYNLKIYFIKRTDILDHKFETKLAFICNPNNPDGIENTIDEIETVISKYPNTIFIIDEAYTEFTSNTTSCISLLKKKENIIIIKSLTKLFCIPGLRLGYMMASSKIISEILNYKMPWNVNSLALNAGGFLFENYNELTPDFSLYLRNTIIFKEKINAISGFEVVPGNTSFFLIKLEKPRAADLKEYLIKEHQLLIRDASNFRTLDQHYIRVSSQTLDKNDLLIKALKQWSC